MTPLRTANVLDEVTQLFTQSDKHLIFVLDGFCLYVRGMHMYVIGGRGRGPSRKGMSSSRVRSAPRARAMVERRRMALRRRMTSSCYAAGQSVGPVVMITRVETRVAYLQLVDEHGDGVELIVRVRRVSHGERDGDGVLAVGVGQQYQGSETMAGCEREDVESLIACKVM